MKLFAVAAAVILVVLAMEAQAITVPGGIIWTPDDRAPRQQLLVQQPSQQRPFRQQRPLRQQLIPQPSEQSFQRVLPSQQQLQRQRPSRQQLLPQASEESAQRVLPNARQTTPESLNLLSATDPILLLVKVEAVTPQNGPSAPLKYEATYVARNRGAIHTAPLPGYSRSAAAINVASAPGTH